MQPLKKEKQHAQIFKELLKEKKIAQTELAEISGMHQSKINRFVNGVIDLNAGEFFQLLDLMPADFQKAYWQRKLGIAVSVSESVNTEESLEKAVEKLSAIEQIRIIKIIAEKGNLFQQPTNGLANTA